MSEKPTYEELMHRVLELTQAEAKLKENEFRYRMIIESIEEGVILQAASGEILDWNKSAEKILGIPAKDTIGQTSESINWPIIFEDGSPFEAKDLPSMVTLKTGKSCKNKIMGLCKPTGEQRWISINTNPIFHEGEKKPYAVAISFFDITDRKQTEQKALEKEKALHLSLDFAKAGMWTWDVLTGDVLWDDQMQKIFGLEPGAFDGSFEAWKERVHPDDVESAERVTLYALEHGKTYEYEYRVKDRNGDWRIINAQASTLKDDSGRPVLMSGFATDITDQKKSEELLRESEEKYRSIFEGAMDGITIFDETGRIMEANEAYCRLVGYSEKELQSLTWADIDTVESPAETEKHIMTILETGNDRFETRHKRKDGKFIDIDVSVRTFNPVNKTFVNFIRDITEQKQAEHMLKAELSMRMTLIDNIPDCIALILRKGTREIVASNKFAQQAGAVPGKTCCETCGTGGTSCLWCLAPKLWETGQHQKKEIEYMGKWYEGIWVPLTDDLYVHYIFDISQRKLMEEKLRQTSKMESICTMAGGIANDFNNLLFRILGNTELILQDISEGTPVHECLEEIEAASLKATGIVKQMLTFGSKAHQDYRPVAAVSAIKETIELLRSMIPATIEIRKSLPDTDVIILSDPIQIGQVLINICNNASQEMENTGGVIEISAEKKSSDREATGIPPELTAGDYLKISIRDTGPGISPDNINRVFDPYFTTKDIGKASGLGLSVVHGIVKNHNGAIFVDSELGKGATFTILFPVVDEEPEIETKITDEIPQGTETILFVDDEEAILKMVQKMLQRLGYQVKAKINPEIALELFKSKPDAFDLVITDMTMPQMTGVRLSEKLKSIRPDIPVIICSGHSSLIDEEKAKELGVDAYVKKPIVKSDIAGIILKVLDETFKTPHQE